MQVGQPAPDFTLDGVLDGEFVEVTLGEQRGNWVVLFFYPLDFTFVCPTEIRGFAQRRAEFEALGAKVFARQRRQQVQPPGLVRARARQARLPAAVRHDAGRRSRVRRAAARRGSHTARDCSSSTRRASCATWSSTTTTWAATPTRRCACCRRCRPASCARSTGSPARGRCRRRATGLRRRADQASTNACVADERADLEHREHVVDDGGMLRSRRTDRPSLEVEARAHEQAGARRVDERHAGEVDDRLAVAPRTASPTTQRNVSTESRSISPSR